MSVAASPVVADPVARRSGTAFWVVLIVLLAAGLLLNWAVPQFGITFRKVAVEPRQPLKMVKSDLGPWVQVSLDRALDPDMEHELGASQYLMRTYVDTRLMPPEDRKALLVASAEDREKLVSKLRVDAKGVMRLMLTYYTGSVDTVPHVPDRCYVADGYKPSTYTVVDWPVLPRDGDDKTVGVRFIEFEDQIDSRRSRPTQVSYFFQVNGVYENNPIFGVRKRLQNLLEKRAYFAKIELRTDLGTPADAQGVMSDFLTSAMPEIERVLPDRTAFVH